MLRKKIDAMVRGCQHTCINYAPSAPRCLSCRRQGIALPRCACADLDGAGLGHCEVDGGPFSSGPVMYSCFSASRLLFCFFLALDFSLVSKKDFSQGMLCFASCLYVGALEPGCQCRGGLKRQQQTLICHR
jgi:hypothetical protein